MGEKRVYVLLNEGGGTIRQEGPEEFRAALATAFSERGMAATIELASGAEIAARLRGALAGGYGAIVVGGGDGTISAAAGILAGTGVPLGVLPLGTLNHFAKDLGLPLEIETAVEAIASGAVRSVDVAEVNGRVFVNNSSVGVYPYMVTERDRVQEHTSFGKYAAMSVAVWRAVRRFPRRRLTVSAEGGNRKRLRTPCVFVGNNTYDMSLLSPGARGALDEGGLCLYVVTHETAWGMLGLALRAAFGKLDEARDFERRCGVAEAEIGSRASRLPVAVDGEVVVLRPPLRYRARPGALRVLVPPAPAAG